MAVRVAEEVLGLLLVGPPISRPGPAGLAVDVPIMYNGFAVDRMHFDPYRLEPLPKGCPEPLRVGGHRAGVDWGLVREAAERVLREAKVLGGAEYERPRRAWRVPVAWRSLIVFHLKIGGDGRVIPDEPLTLELRRHLP